MVRSRLVGWWLAVPLVAGTGAWIALRDGTPPTGAGETGARTTVESPAGDVLEGVSEPTLKAAPRGALTIRGRAMLTSGRPAAGARVTASLKRGAVLARATAAADGAFTLAGLVKDAHLLEARWDEGESVWGAEAVVGAGVEGFELLLSQRPRSLTFLVLDPAGEPVPRFDARLVRPKGVQGLGTRGEGRIRLEVGALFTRDGVHDYRGAHLEVWNARDLDDRGLGLAPKRIGPFEGTEREVEVRLAHGPTFEGRVTTTQGLPATGVYLTLALPKQDESDAEGEVRRLLEQALPDGVRPQPAPAAPAPPFTGLSARVAVAPDGRFRIACLQAEVEHRLEVEPGEAYLAVPARALRPGDGPLEIVLRPAANPRVTVLGPDGRPAARARVQARFEPTPEEAEARRNADEWNWLAGEWVSERTDDGGVATLAGLDPERTYTLEVEPSATPAWLTPPGDRTRRLAEPPLSLQKARRDGWRPADTRVDLEPGLTLSGRVLDAADKPAAVARVSLEGDGTHESAHTDEEGRFAFRGIRPGKIRLRAVPAGTNPGALLLTDNVWVEMPESPEVGESHRPEPARRPETLEVDLAASLDGVVLRVPTTLSVTLRLPHEPPQGAAPQGPAALLGFFAGAFRQVTVLARPGKRWRAVEHEGLDVEGLLEGRDATCQIHGLDAATEYAVWMPPHDGHYVYQPLDPKAGDVILLRKTGGTLSGRVLDLPPGAVGARVSIQDELGRVVQDVRTDPLGAWQIRGLPLSTWSVRAVYRTGRKRLGAEGQAATDGVIDLRLVPVKEGDEHGRILLEADEAMEEIVGEDER